MSHAALPEIVLLDLDDTILRFSAGQPDCWQLALERHVPERDDHALLLAALRAESAAFWGPAERAFWGRQNLHAARRLIACSALATRGLSPASSQRIADEMTEQKESLARPFEGALEAVAALRRRGHRLGLLTNGSAEFQRRKLQRFELEAAFELILIEGELGYGKPDRRVFEGALAFFGARPQQACMVGDNLEADIAGARSAGIATVWHDALGEGVPPAAPARPDRVIRSLRELLAWPASPRDFTSSAPVVG